jgi:hypothetical protein
MSVCAAFMFFVVLLALTLRTLLLWENRKWDKEQALRGLQLEEQEQQRSKAYHGEETTGESFRNIL